MCTDCASALGHRDSSAIMSNPAAIAPTATHTWRSVIVRGTGAVADWDVASCTASITSATPLTFDTPNRRRTKSIGDTADRHDARLGMVRTSGEETRGCRLTAVPKPPTWVGNRTERHADVGIAGTIRHPNPRPNSSPASSGSPRNLMTGLRGRPYHRHHGRAGVDRASSPPRPHLHPARRFENPERLVAHPDARAGRPEVSPLEARHDVERAGSSARHRVHQGMWTPIPVESLPELA